MSCVEEKLLAAAAESDYIPKCRTDNPSLYDGCQCDIGNLRQLGQCRCVDESGNILPDINARYVEDQDSFKRVCVEELQCENSEYELN